jgi:hypothetical protein
MTKRSRPFELFEADSSPEGSRVLAKSRFRRYSVSWAPALRLELPLVVTAMTAP